MTPRLRIAAIDFLNPAPLMWNFEHPPQAGRLAERYVIKKMTPSACATALADGSADIGLIPIAAYPLIPGLAVIPGCAIASLGSIRSLLLVIRSSWGQLSGEEPDLDPPTTEELAGIKTVALDTASRTSAVYTQILFRRYWQHTPRFLPHATDLDAMLQAADAALLIGDPALYALRDRAARLARTGERLRYLDLGALWRQATGTAWVSAFWAMRQTALEPLDRPTRALILADFKQSREAGLANRSALAEQWSHQLHLNAKVVLTYLNQNIYYRLDGVVQSGLERFYREAHALDLLPASPTLRWV